MVRQARLGAGALVARGKYEVGQARLDKASCARKVALDAASQARLDGVGKVQLVAAWSGWQVRRCMEDAV